MTIKQLSFLPRPCPPARPTQPVTEEHIASFCRHMRREATLLRWSWRSNTKALEAHYRAQLIRLLHAAGIAHIAVQGPNDHTDLIVAGWPVELKFSTSTARRPHYYQFKIRPTQRQAARFFICVTIPPNSPIIPYIIPAEAITTATVEITSHPATYAGQWATYRAAYALLKGEPDGT
jgi:hypothetical protein